MIFKIIISWGQSITIDTVNANISLLGKKTEFIFLNEHFNPNYYTWVADLSCSFGENDAYQLAQFYEAFWKQANELSADGFKVIQGMVSQNQNTIQLSVYRIKSSKIKTIEAKNNEGRLTVFGAIDLKNTDGHLQFYLGEEKYNVPNFQYMDFYFKSGQKTSVKFKQGLKTTNKSKFQFNYDLINRYVCFSPPITFKDKPIITNIDSHYAEFLRRVLQKAN